MTKFSRNHIGKSTAMFTILFIAGRTRRGGSTSDGSASSDLDLTERATRAATEKLARMEDRLKGKITEHDGFSQILPMSVEGQVSSQTK